MHRLSIAVVAALAAALVVVSLSAAAYQRSHAKHTFPHRIVSLSPTVTEDLFAIGAGKQVVAVDNGIELPGARSADEPVRLHAERRGDRELPPGPRPHLVRPRQL